MRQLTTQAIAFAVLSSALLAQGAVTGPCFETTLGTNLNLGDDDVAAGLPLGFNFPGPGGTSVPAISISSNGFVWLGTRSDPGCCDGDSTKLVAQMARIAPLWTDLDPSSGGAVWFNTFPAGPGVPARAVITWDAVPEFGQSNLQSFQLQMYDDGSFSLFFDPNTIGPWAHSSLIGISEGGGATQNFVDISATTGVPYDSGANPTLFEQFFFGFDLSASAWSFTPNGNGGYTLTNKANCAFATVTSFGVGCPAPASSYELFDTSHPFDLANTAIEFLPNGSGGYVATPAVGFFSSYTGAQFFNDDDSHGPFNLPFTFPYPGGTTSAIDIASNGFIWLQAGNFNSRCCNADAGTFVADPASIAGLWMDLYPPGAPSTGGIFFDVVGTTEAHITWVDVPEYPGIGSNTFQITLRSNGTFRLSWGNANVATHSALVGLTQDFANVDPGPTDYSAGIFLIANGGTPLGLAAQAGSRPAIGSNFVMEIDRISAGSVFGFMVLGLTGFPTGFDLTPIGMPGCQLYASTDSLLSFPLTGAPTPFAFPIPANQSLAGIVVDCQAATLTPGANPLNLLSSNGLELLIGF